MSPSQRILRFDSKANYRVTKRVIRETPRLTVLSILPVRQMSRPTLAVIHSLLDKGLCPTRLSVAGDEGEVRGHHRDRQQDLRGDKVSDHGTSGINFVSVCFRPRSPKPKSHSNSKKIGRALTVEKKLNRLYNFFVYLEEIHVFLIRCQSKHEVEMDSERNKKRRRPPSRRRLISNKSLKCRKPLSFIGLIFFF